MQIDRKLESGPVEAFEYRVNELTGEPIVWRKCYVPGDSLSEFDQPEQDEINQHWNEDVGGGVTRAQRYAVILASNE